MDYTKSGFGFRISRKSKYLSDPYISNIRPKPKKVKEVVASVHQQQNVETNSNGGSSSNHSSSSAPEASQNLSVLLSKEENIGQKKRKEEVVSIASDPEPHASQEEIAVENNITDHNLTVNTNKVEDNGEKLRNCLLLRFAPGSFIPSKEDLLITFFGFGPLKATETKLLKDTTSAQVVFVRSEDAAAAFQGLEQNKFGFSSSLVDYKLLDHLIEVCPPNGSLKIPTVTPNQPNVSRAMPAQTPPSLQFMKHNSKMMLSMLENSGNRICPNMRATLDFKIKNLLRKVNSRLGHTSP